MNSMNSTFIPFTFHLHSTSINPFYPNGPWLPRLGAGRGQGIRGLLPDGRFLGGASWEVLVREAGFGLGAAGGDVGSFLTKKKGSGNRAEHDFVQASETNWRAQKMVKCPEQVHFFV